MVKRKKIALIDRIPLFRSGIRLTLQQAGFKVVAEGGAASDAVAIVERMGPDAMLLDLSSGTGLEVALQLLQVNPGLGLMIIVAGELFREVGSYLRAGARGCISKEASADEFIAAVEAVASGGTYVSPAVRAHLDSEALPGTDPPEQSHGLSSRELLMLTLVANGDSNKAIARKLGIGDQTAKNYMTRLMKKLHVRNRLEAAIYFRNMMR